MSSEDTFTMHTTKEFRIPSTPNYVIPTGDGHSVAIGSFNDEEVSFIIDLMTYQIWNTVSRQRKGKD